MARCPNCREYTFSRGGAKPCPKCGTPVSKVERRHKPLVEERQRHQARADRREELALMRIRGLDA